MDNTEPNIQESKWKIPRTILDKVLLVLLSIIFALFALFILYVLYMVWPDSQNANPFVKNIWIIGTHTFSQDKQYFLLMVLGGAFGSVLHIIVSFVAFVGNQAFQKRWLPWYFLRPIIGAGIALTFYLLLRGGLMTYNTQQSNPQTNVVAQSEITKKTASNVDTAALNKASLDTVLILLKTNKIAAKTKEDTSARIDSFKKLLSTGVKFNVSPTNSPNPLNKEQLPLNPFGLLSIAILAGLFSRLASKKLEEVFSALFNIKDEIIDKDKLPNDPKKTN